MSSTWLQVTAIFGAPESLFLILSWLLIEFFNSHNRNQEGAGSWI
jgi:hypothetical protein